MMKLVIRYSILFWVIFFILVTYFLSPSGELDIVLIRVTMFVVPQALIFYFNLLYLLPNYLERQKREMFYTLLFMTLIFFVGTFGTIDIFLNESYPLNFKHGNDRPTAYMYFGRLMSFVPPIIIGALIRKSILLQQKTKESLELQNKMLAAETKALKAQINPHFLFNTLNNIYSLSQLDNTKTGDAILQLSDILRYVTYEGNQKLVSLSAELEHINSFIKLQLLRDEDDSNITFETDIANKSLQIAPLILIPFIENCFKHGNHHDKINGWIRISIKTEGSILTLVTANSTSNESLNKDKIGGVGMENVKKRLSLLYAQDHNLILTMDKYKYQTTLTINLKHEMHNY